MQVQVVEGLIRQIGLAPTKARNIISMSQVFVFQQSPWLESSDSCRSAEYCLACAANTMGIPNRQTTTRPNILSWLQIMSVAESIHPFILLVAQACSGPGSSTEQAWCLNTLVDGHDGQGPCTFGGGAKATCTCFSQTGGHCSSCKLLPVYPCSVLQPHRA